MSFPHAMTETEFQAQVIELAEILGWRVYHVSDVRKRLRARTSPGFPDLVLVRERALYRECKDDRRQLEKEQKAWRDVLLAAGQDWALWRPRMWVEIQADLTERR